MNFVELNAKSCFSFLQGASHPEELVETAHRLGYRGLSLCDRHGFYGMVRAFEQSKLSQFPVFYGVEVEVEFSALVLLARSFQGYRRLCRLVSEAFVGQSKGAPIFQRSHLESWLDPKNIEVLLAPRQFPSRSLLKLLCEIGPVTQLVTRTRHPDRDKAMKDWLKSLPSDFQKAWSWDPCYHRAHRHELYEVMQAIRKNKPLSESLPTPNAELFLHPLSELTKAQVPEAWIQKTASLADSLEFSPESIRYRYPQEWLPDGKTSPQFLRELCELGATKRYPEGIPESAQKQLDYELEIVRDLQFEDYFLTVWDIVQFARAQKILCQGRGSAANSVICYLLEITSIDPVRMNLLFERFVSRERNEAPDIDVDFEHERREEVIQYIYQKYGRHRAGMVATLITYRTRSALRDTGKALGIPPEALDVYSKKVRWRENVFNETRESPKKARWFRLAQELKGFPRHIGQHTGGMILTQDRLDETSPVEPASMEGRSVVQWDKYDIEKLGLLKIDILSLGMLTCIRKCFELIEKYHGKRFELHTIPADDEKTYEMIAKAHTVGVFQIESRAQMSMLPRLKPKNFYDLVVEVAIVRPGPIQGGMVHPYLRRRMGLEPVTYEHPKLKPILEKTLGVPIFQEQVMKMAIEVAGYSPGEADALRRAMGAWKKRGQLDEHANEICRRLILNGVGESFAKRICDQILGFGEYGFPESHAASFALLTYASAFLKAHYPSAFLAALLNSMPMGFYALHVLTAAFQREGVRILPVHTEFSEWDHTLEKIEGSDALRLGFRCVRGLQKDHTERFIKKRQAGELDLYIFDVDERAALAMASEQQRRREAYWQALKPNKDSLSLKEGEETSFKNLDPLASMLLDFEFTQTTLAAHPAELLKKHEWLYSFPKEKLILAKDLPHLKNGQLVTVFGITQVVQSPPTAKGMFFITLEDETGFLNLVLSPPVYERYKEFVQHEWALLIRGVLQSLSGSLSLLVKMIYPKEPRRGHSAQFPEKSKTPPAEIPLRQHLFY